MTYDGSSSGGGGGHGGHRGSGFVGALQSRTGANNGVLVAPTAGQCAPVVFYGVVPTDARKTDSPGSLAVVSFHQSGDEATQEADPNHRATACRVPPSPVGRLLRFTEHRISCSTCDVGIHTRSSRRCWCGWGWPEAERHASRAAVNVALVPGGSSMNRIRACVAVRRVRAPTGRFSRSYLAAGLDPGGFPRASARYVCGARTDSTLRGELPTARCGLRITFVSSKWTTRKVDQVPNTEAFANLPQLGSGGRKETAQQSIPAEPLHPLMPALGVAIQPLKDPG